ncbi:MAG TPA: hypothetical protein VL595_36190 [Pseudonocardia sp.]|jgi:hypothetical protein|nr:hypothetical protein [Pseudonocardia sp.]
MVRTNIAVWIVAVVILVATVVVVVITGHRQGDNSPITGGQAQAPASAPLNAALAGLGLGPEDFEPRGPGGSTPAVRRPAELSSATGVGGSRSAAAGASANIARPVVQQVTCQPSLLQTVLGLVTSLLGGGARC